VNDLPDQAMPAGVPEAPEAGATASNSVAGIAAAVAAGVRRMLEEAMDCAVLVEFPLKSGRRADLMALDGQGRFLLIEIKSGPADFRSDNKWPDYAAWADQFYFAVPETFPQGLLPQAEGLIVANPYEAAILRDAAPRPPLNPARRKALTLRFARIAARRLSGASAPAVI
jgi:hypothetical protein